VRPSFIFAIRASCGRIGANDADGDTIPVTADSAVEQLESADPACELEEVLGAQDSLTPSENGAERDE